VVVEPRVRGDVGAGGVAGRLGEVGEPGRGRAACRAGGKEGGVGGEARRTDDIEAWVEQIPYPETHKYVKRVTLSWEEYRRIYASE
jgi:hypothetical protein